MHNNKKENLEYVLSTFFLFFGLFYLRLRRIFYSFSNLSFKITNFGDFFYFFSSLFSDLIFVAVLFFCFRFIISKVTNQKVSLILFVIYKTVCSIILVYSLCDFAFYQTSAKFISFSQIDIVKGHIFDLFDSFLIYTNFFDIFILLFCILSICLSRFILIFLKKYIKYDFHFNINPYVLVFIFLFSIFFYLYIDFSGQKYNNYLGVQSVIALFTHFDSNNDAKIETKYSDASNDVIVSKKFSRDSKNFPLSLMDRKVLQSIKSKLPKDKKDYNIVFYLSESTFAGYYPMYNDNTANVGVSPFLESHLDNALLLKNMYTTGVRSINSLISLLTGVGGYPGYKQINNLEDYLDTPALSQILSQRGYKSALVHGGNFYFYEKMSFLQNRDFDFLIDAAMLKKLYPNSMSNSWGIDDRLIVKEGLKWIDKQISDKKPFTLTLIPIAPHHPYDIPSDIKKYISNPKDDYQSYLNSLYYVDEVFKMLWEGLDSRGILDNTIIVFLADHGEAFGQHKGNFGHENNIYQENVRVPGIFFNKTLFSGYNELETVANLSDILPTVLEIVGEDKPLMCQGESILSRNVGKYSFFACGERNVDIGMIDGNYKAVYDYVNNQMKLYDLKAELFDFTDISTNEPKLTIEYKKILTDYYVYQKDFLENFNKNVQKIKLSEQTQTSVSLLDMTPFFKSQDKYPIKKNCNFEDKPIKINEIIYNIGYGVHANSDMKFDLKNLGFTRFKGLAGKIDVPSWRQNFLEMRIYLDGMLKFTTGQLTTDDPPVQFDIDVSDGEVLELMVLDGGDNDRYDDAAWIEPILIK